MENKHDLFAVAFLSLVLLIVGCAADRAENSREDVPRVYSTADAWHPKRIAGRSFVPFSQGNFPRWKEPDWDSELYKLPLFADMGYQLGATIGNLQDVYRVGHGWKKEDIRLRPANELRQTPYTMEDYMAQVRLQNKGNRLIRGVFEEGGSTAFMANVHDARPAAFLHDGYNADRAAYEAWKQKHPGFVGFKVLTEYDNDINAYNGIVETIENEKLRTLLLSRLPVARDGKAWMEQFRTVFRRETELHFGETERTWALNSVSCSLAHQYAAVGVKGLIYEAELCHVSAPWVFGGAFTRGAARQYDIPYIWYTAQLVGTNHGFRRDGTPGRGEVEWPGSWVGHAKPHPAEPWKGVGLSLFKRNLAYGMLIGASGIFPENTQYYLFEDGPDGKKRPSPWAKAWNDVYVFGRDTDRGATYTPIAILTSLYETFHRHGHARRNRDRHAQNAFFFTLVPTCRKDVYRVSDGKKGDLGCLFNSPFGEIWDDLAPDAGQDSAAFLKALSAYRAAFLVGHFEKQDLDTRALVDYVREGGTLFVSSDQIADGHFPAEVAGVSFGDGRRPVGAFFTDRKGEQVALKDPYTFWAGNPAADAKPFLFAADKTPMGWGRKVGRGRVVTVGVKRFLPDESVWSTEPNGFWEKDQQSITDGSRTFPLVKYLLEKAQAAYMPCKVEGSCQWGVNRVPSAGNTPSTKHLALCTKHSPRWLFWAMNNEGVTKFSGEPDEYDLSKTSHVRVTFKQDAGGASFEFDLKPGAVRTVFVTGDEAVVNGEL